MSEQLAREVWERYEYCRDRGHRDYCAAARLCERFYLGGGLQWSADDLAALRAAGRPAHEINLVMPAVNAAIGYQISNRMDISFRPRGMGADDDLATVHSKIAMQIADRNHLHWRETEVFADGLIQQRGFYDVRIGFDDHMTGSVEIAALDPLDVIPDPDAKGYEPDTWSDVLITRWWTLDDIELLYGKGARKEVEAYRPTDADFGEESAEEGRNKFGVPEPVYGSWQGEGYGTIPRVRVVERRQWKLTRQDAAIYPSGDVRPLADGEVPPDGAIVTKRMMRRPRITVATESVVLHDDWSPYRRLMIVPYFPVFRRGLTRGMVDNAVSPQEILNKEVSQYLHVLNTTANSGWLVEEGSLINMTTEDLEAQGAQTGLVVEYKMGRPAPTKIPANQIPTGIDRLIDRSSRFMQEATGITEAFKGMSEQVESGIAVQSRQQAAQNSIALALDNLGRTRHLLAEHILELVQQFYTEPRVLRITETDAFGRKQSVPLAINQPTEAGPAFNDLTIGEYDVVISEQPMQVTFENSQFEQALELRKVGVAVPDEIVIRHSNLADKEEVARIMAERGQQQADPTLAAKAKLLEAQAEKTQAEQVNKAVEAQYSAIQTAKTIASMPQTANLADALLRSAGYVDRDAAPIVPQLPGALPGIEPPPQNTNPITPRNPGVGINAGIESQAK